MDNGRTGGDALPPEEPRLEADRSRPAPARTTQRAEPADVYGDARLWADFSDAADTAQFLKAWLTLQCRMIGGAEAAAVFAEGTADGGGPAFAPVAAWPAEPFPMEPLRLVAEAAGKAQAAHVERGGADAPAILAVPIAREGRVRMVVALRVANLGTRELRGTLRRLQWGAGWLATRMADAAAREAHAFVRRAQAVLDLLALANEHVRHEAAAMALANEVQTSLRLANVAIGLVSGGRNPVVRLVALSRAAWFRGKSTLVADLENAMGEALDQNTTIAIPEAPDAVRRIAVAHRAYARTAGMGAVATFVLADSDGPCGALLMERRDAEPWPAETLALGEMLAAMIGPALVLKRRQRRWLSGRLVDGIGAGLRAVLGHRRPSLKLAALALAAFAAYLVFVPGDFRVSADAVLEGSVQRAAVVPFDGFLKEASVRAGDVVAAGQVLARLDDSDLSLEALQWQSEYARLSQQQRAAMAALDRSEVALLVAQIDQARANLELAQARLARTEITAPIAGVVIAGDLSQRLGAPLSQGEVLFEIAPLDAYRLAIQVDERDLRHVAVGQAGELLLAGRADARLPIVVTRITSVAEVVDGRNAFRVEASLGAEAAGIRPGMEGVAKIDIDQRPVGWIWTRSLIEWARVFVWKWTP